MLPEHYLLLIFALLPLINKYSFWLYTIQLKEYRWDRFKEYLSTPQWKSAIINVWSIIELPLFLVSLVIFINSPFEIIIYNVLFIFLLIQNLFVFRKVISWRFIKPKFTWRLMLTLIFLILWFSWDLSYIIYNEIGNTIYSYILFVYLFAPIIIYFIILITLPFVNYLKNKKINNAIIKSNKLNKPIKIWITWSYGKSSVKEYLASILEQDWNILKTPDNINTELWVSAIVLNKLKNNYKYFIAEMWAYKIGEIDLLWKIVNHKYGFLTAIWNQHLWLFWSQKNIRVWKSEIANSVLKNNWILYINWNNDEIRKANFDKNLNIIKYWNHKKSDAFYTIIETKNAITEFNFKYKKIDTKFKTNLIWEHNILNLTWVLAFCYDIWLKTTDLKKYLKNIKSPNNTLNLIKKDKYILIDDTYNLSEAWLYAWINVLNSFKWEKILVLDDILELWKISENFHFVLWKEISKTKGINKVLFVWINYKKSFIEWLIDWWFKKENILYNLDNIKKDSIILFEWRNAKKYFNFLK
jgi:UDP-N-acetylmuramoyl-tripeptide--D-alanyl-D-alanine ligase